MKRIIGVVIALTLLFASVCFGQDTLAVIILGGMRKGELPGVESKPEWQAKLRDKLTSFNLDEIKLYSVGLTDKTPWSIEPAGGVLDQGLGQGRGWLGTVIGNSLGIDTGYAGYELLTPYRGVKFVVVSKDVAGADLQKRESARPLPPDPTLLLLEFQKEQKKVLNEALENFESRARENRQAIAKLRSILVGYVKSRREMDKLLINYFITSPPPPSPPPLTTSPNFFFIDGSWFHRESKESGAGFQWGDFRGYVGTQLYCPLNIKWTPMGFKFGPIAARPLLVGLADYCVQTEPEWDVEGFNPGLSLGLNAELNIGKLQLTADLYGLSGGIDFIKSISLIDVYDAATLEIGGKYNFNKNYFVSGYSQYLWDGTGLTDVSILGNGRIASYYLGIGPSWRYVGSELKAQLALRLLKSF